MAVTAAVRRPRRFLFRGPMIPLVVFGFFVAAALLGPFVYGNDAYSFSLTDRLVAPSWAHPFGTDELGRDILARMLLGARVTLAVVCVSIAIGGFLGLALGVISGYFGGIVDSVISRFTDATLAFPTLLFGLLFAVSVGAGFGPVVAAISLSLWAEFIKVIRAEVMSLKEREFIAQCKVYGLHPVRILAVHIVPNVLNTFVVLMGVNLGKVVLTEASLSYLGAGIPQPTPSWGNMVSEGQAYVTNGWWISFFPGLAISLSVLALFLIADWLRDFLDPKFVKQAARPKRLRRAALQAPPDNPII